VVILGSIEFEHMAPAGPDPLGGDGYEPKDELFEPEGGLQPPNALRVGANNIAVEISDNGRENHKGGILRQERTWQPRPAKIVIHYIKEPLAVPAFIVEGDDIFGGPVGIVGQDGPPGV